MTKKVNQYPNPRFSTLEEEDEYWKTHSPLDEGYEGEIQKSKQKRSSFLSIRLTGEELTQLRDMAAKLGMGPSTYARQLLSFIIEQKNWGMPYPSSPPPSFLLTPLYDSSGKHKSKVGGPRESRSESFAESIVSGKKVGKRICLLDIDEIAADPTAIQQILEVLFRVCKARVVTPEDDAYKTVELIVKASE